MWGRGQKGRCFRRGVSHFLFIDTKTSHSLRMPVEAGGESLCKLAPGGQALGKRVFSLQSSPDPGENFLSVVRQYSYSKGTAQTRNLKFQKCDKAQTGSPRRQAAAWWPLMKWLLKEVGRLIPAAERRAGQRPRNAQPGGGRAAVAPQPRARPKTNSAVSA